ncbi:MAG TPA: hypothetical protein VK465_10850, partial [Fibrobacteria bacterium]|nr:hypothetical protein [Fibrobacteria bacterium]
MNRIFLFITSFVFPVATFSQVASRPDTFADNWETVAAGGGRFFFALIAGILLAYAFQWILTSLSLATGATAMGAATKKQRKSYYREKDRDEKDVPDREESWEKPVMKIQSGIGIWALVTTGISTFIACWLASELLRFGGRAEAVILCLTIWAGFMLSMMWMEASLLGTVFGHIVNTFKGGVKSAFGPIKSMAGAAGEKASATLEEVTAKVKEEFAAQRGGEGIKDRLKGFASGIQTPSLERSRIERDSEHLFHDEDVREAARQGGRIDRRRIEEIVASRGDLGPDDSRTLTEVLHGRWNECVEETRQSQGAPSHAFQSSNVQ